MGWRSDEDVRPPLSSMPRQRLNKNSCREESSGIVWRTASPAAAILPAPRQLVHTQTHTQIHSINTHIPELYAIYVCIVESEKKFDKVNGYLNSDDFNDITIKLLIK